MVLSCQRRVNSPQPQALVSSPPPKRRAVHRLDTRRCADYARWPHWPIRLAPGGVLSRLACRMEYIQCVCAFADLPIALTPFSMPDTTQIHTNEWMVVFAAVAGAALADASLRGTDGWRVPPLPPPRVRATNHTPPQTPGAVPRATVSGTGWFAGGPTLADRWNKKTGGVWCAGRPRCTSHHPPPEGAHHPRIGCYKILWPLRWEGAPRPPPCCSSPSNGGERCVSTWHAARLPIPAPPSPPPQLHDHHDVCTVVGASQVRPRWSPTNGPFESPQQPTPLRPTGTPPHPHPRWPFLPPAHTTPPLSDG